MATPQPSRPSGQPLALLLEAIGTQLVAALDPLPYRRNESTADAWTLSLDPLGVLGPTTANHLDLYILPRSSRPTNNHNNSLQQGIQYRTLVDVIFTFVLDHTAKWASLRLASDAAADVVREMLEIDLWHSPDVEAFVLERFAPTLVDDGLILDVTTTFEIHHKEGR